MKKFNFSKYSYLAMGVIALAGGLCSCSEDEFIANKDLVSKLERFKFNTSDEVTLDINYGLLASRALVQVYEEDPFANATDADAEPQGETVFTTFLDEYGRFTGEINLPAHVKQLYAVSSSLGAPYIVKTNIKDGKATLSAGSNAVRSAAPKTRATGDEPEYIVRQLKPEETGNGNISNLWTISDGWNVYGKSNDANHLEDEGHLTNQDIVDLQNFLWQGATSKPSKPNPGSDRWNFVNGLKTEGANVVVLHEYEDPITGNTVEVDNAELWFTFVNEYAWNENALGYYYYPEGQKPASKDDLKLFVCVPNASVANNAPFGTQNSYGFHSNEDAPIKTNHRVQLLYVDDEGNVSKNFPPGTTIGFFTIVDGFNKGSKYGTETTTVKDKNYYTTRTKGGISTADKRYYSNKEFNQNNETHYIAVRMADGTIVYGVEDGSDWSYDDVLFTVTANPNLAMHPESDNVADVPQEHVQEKFYTNRDRKFTYLFEDIWPNGGDYDLNDVIVRHSREITYNQYNFVSEVKEIFKFEPTPTTTYKDAFAFVIPESHMSSELILPDGAVFEQETNSVFLTESAEKLYGKTVTVIRRGFMGVSMKDIFNEFINPYIVNQTGHPAWNEQGRVEIHLPNGSHTAVTSKALVVNDPLLSAYVDKSGKYPFAIEIPNITFIPCDERVRIGSVGNYQNFTKWTESLGKSYTDWYKTK